MKAPFLGCGLYGIALSALIYTSAVTNAVLDLFLRAPYQTGTHQQDWMNWHGMGCFFVGLVNLLAWRWTEARPRRDVALATAVVYGVWSLQNVHLMFTGRFTPIMWLHVAGCAVAAGFALAYVVTSAPVADGGTARDLATAEQRP